MRKIIDIEHTTVKKLKLLAAIEGKSVKKLMEDAISWYVDQKQKERMNSLSASEKEDLGLLVLMQQATIKSTVSEDELFDT